MLIAISGDHKKILLMRMKCVTPTGIQREHITTSTTEMISKELKIQRPLEKMAVDGDSFPLL